MFFTARQIALSCEDGHSRLSKPKLSIHIANSLCSDSMLTEKSSFAQRESMCSRGQGKHRFTWWFYFSTGKYISHLDWVWACQTKGWTLDQDNFTKKNSTLWAFSATSVPPVTPLCITKCNGQVLQQYWITKRSKTFIIAHISVGQRRIWLI